MAAKAASVKALTGGVATLFKANKVSSVRGVATITGPNEVKCCCFFGSKHKFQHLFDYFIVVSFR